MNFLKSTLTTMIYTIVLIIIFELINFLFVRFVDIAFLPLFDKFSSLNWVLRFLIIFGGGIYLPVFVVGQFNWIAMMVSRFMSYIFPFNQLRKAISIVLCVLNIILLEIRYLDLLSWNFLTIFMWLILSLSIIEINSIFILRNLSN